VFRYAAIAAYIGGRGSGFMRRRKQVHYNEQYSSDDHRKHDEPFAYPW